MQLLYSAYSVNFLLTLQPRSWQSVSKYWYSWQPCFISVLGLSWIKFSPQVFNAKTAELMSHHQVEVNQSYPKEGWVPRTIETFSLHWSAGYFSINCLFKNASSYVLFRLTNQPKPKCIAVIIFSKVWHDKNINFAFLPLCFIITQQSQVQPQKNSSNQQNHIFLLQLVVQTTLDVYYTLNLQFSIVALC